MRPRAFSRMGFTLIEMLVVITIIAILAAMVMGGINIARRKALVSTTEATLKTLAAALERYEGDFQDYPPSDGDLSGKGGAVLLYECLRTEKKGGPFIGDNELPTDKLDGKLVFVDAFKNPIYYIHHRDYRNQAPMKRTFRLFSAGPDREINNGEAGSDDIVNWNKDKPDQ